MPELPEVEVVRRGVEDWAVGSRIEAIEILDERSLRRHHQGPEHFSSTLMRQIIGPARRRGKYLWLELISPAVADSATEALVIHLGMSGQVLFADPGRADHRHLRVRITLEPHLRSELMRTELRFVDQRIFGGLYLDKLAPAEDDPQQLVPTTVSHIGRDPLDPLFDIEAVYQAIRRRKTNIKRALLDQNLVSGIGNIYADEALWAARLHYTRPTETLTRREVARLYNAVQDVLVQSLKEGGTTFDGLYVNVEGESGYFDRSLNVYGRAGELCGRCLDAGAEVAIVRERFMNRSSAFCPGCQPIPRRGRR